MLQDPSEILTRVPELELLAGEPSIRKAVEAGDPFKVYRALFWARLLGRLPAHRETLTRLLGNRRLFAKAIKGTPWLGTLNGVGATLLGESERDPEGTHVATHAVVIFFVVPLLPLGAYVVRKENSGVFRSSWRIFARVPMGPMPWLWSRLVAAGAVASVLLGAAAAVHSARYGQVRVLNAFEVPVDVTVGEKKATVPARGDAVLSARVGKHPARAATADGIEVDALDLEVTSGRRVLAWNLAGAMPTFLVDVVYTAEKAPAEAPAPPTRAVYCGERLIQLPSVDYAFRAPDKSVSMPAGSGRVVKSYLDYERGEGAGLRRCSEYLAAKGREADAAGFLEVAARIARWEAYAATLAVHARIFQSVQEALRIAKEGREARPAEVDAHRLYQVTAEEAGNRSALIEEYRKRAEAEPASADAQYLYARLLHGTEGRAVIDRLVVRFPDHVYLLRAAVYLRFRAGDWKGAHEAWTSLRARSADAAADTTDEEIRALVAMGKFADGMKLAGATFEKAPLWVRAMMAHRFARAAAVAGIGASDVLIARVERDAHLPNGEKLWLLREQSGLKVPTEVTAPGLALARALAKDPAGALRLAGSASGDDLRALDHGAWALLYCEAARTGNAELERSLRPFAGASVWGELAAMRKLARLELAVSPDLDLDPEVLAAALLVRARNPSLPEPERRMLLDQARRLDVLRGPVTSAIPVWKI
jgi:hypothetical protein